MPFFRLFIRNLSIVRSIKFDFRRLFMMCFSVIHCFSKIEFLFMKSIKKKGDSFPVVSLICPLALSFSYFRFADSNCKFPSADSVFILPFLILLLFANGMATKREKIIKFLEWRSSTWYILILGMIPIFVFFFQNSCSNPFCGWQNSKIELKQLHSIYECIRCMKIDTEKTNKWCADVYCSICVDSIYQ